LEKQLVQQTQSHKNEHDLEKQVKALSEGCLFANIQKLVFQHDLEPMKPDNMGFQRNRP
jgi:hypothetical protein